MGDEIAALDGIARVEGSRVRYIKAHGALYHRVRRDQAQAAALVEAILAYDSADSRPSYALAIESGSAEFPLVDRPHPTMPR